MAIGYGGCITVVCTPREEEGTGWSRKKSLDMNPGNEVPRASRTLLSSTRVRDEYEASVVKGQNLIMMGDVKGEGNKSERRCLLY